MADEKDPLALESEIFDILKTIYDPEIPVSIFELGLIYRVEMQDDGTAEIDMTLTAPNCPMADDLLAEVEQKTAEIAGVKKVKLKLTFDPPWEKSMMSDEARLELGML